MFRDLSCTMHRHNVHWRGGEGGNGQTESARPTYDEKYKIQNAQCKTQNTKCYMQQQDREHEAYLHFIKNEKYEIQNT